MRSQSQCELRETGRDYPFMRCRLYTRCTIMPNHPARARLVFLRVAGEVNIAVHERAGVSEVRGEEPCPMSRAKLSSNAESEKASDNGAESTSG